MVESVNENPQTAVFLALDEFKVLVVQIIEIVEVKAAAVGFTRPVSIDPVVLIDVIIVILFAKIYPILSGFYLAFTAYLSYDFNKESF